MKSIGTNLFMSNLSMRIIRCLLACVMIVFATSCNEAPEFPPDNLIGPKLKIPQFWDVKDVVVPGEGGIVECEIASDRFNGPWEGYVIGIGGERTYDIVDGKKVVTSERDYRTLYGQYLRDGDTRTDLRVSFDSATGKIRFSLPPNGGKFRYFHVVMEVWPDAATYLFRDVISVHQPRAEEDNAGD